MERTRLINAALVLLAMLVVGAFAFAVRLEAAADSVAVLRTHGMTCGSCASRIEQTLRHEKGVASVDVDVNAGRVVVGYDSKKVRPEAIAEQVTGSGYGSSILQVVTPEQYRSMTGQNIAASRQQGGCGSGCCGTGR